MKRDAEVDFWGEVVWLIVTHHDVSVVTQGGEHLVIESSITRSRITHFMNKFRKLGLIDYKNDRYKTIKVGTSNATSPIGGKPSQ